ncbi:DUF2752 domain-containing protein [Micromonospora sp. NPDC049679]|uniref:DUF2752 domain-containing protein n=1 Tax=Micromonospora sp. NPDC049679 TaxID=3155920 RepID=UPI00340D99EB
MTSVVDPAGEPATPELAGSTAVGGADPQIPSGGAPGDGADSYPPYVMPEPDRLTRFVNRWSARAPRWLAPVAALGCIAGAVGYTTLVDPTDSTADAAPTCLLKLTTGLDCPGCGGTRAFWYVLHGDLPAAARHHILFVFALPFLLYLYVAWAGERMFRWRLPQLRITPAVVGVFLAAWLAFSVLRNLPWAPFAWLYV